MEAKVLNIEAYEEKLMLESYNNNFSVHNNMNFNQFKAFCKKHGVKQTVKDLPDIVDGLLSKIAGR